ncbi:pentapeptide repeat-containing protein [Nostoc cycadae]|uniref:Pentapeptide repeat-containing protein n=1 Tax=Nostoc cycadae WK-1 TaxID=1861711 RepID=A0A2H6LPA6_9NOSO|nr:pentapeptide repeat-containing protein [Nostoc cycadae]GBE95050.1 pentapeptide repeat-containing protein [Nostoc cycadae WK-1]
MSSKTGILIKQPVSILNKRLNVNFGSFFTALAKTAANAATANLGNVPENVIEMGAAIGLAKEPGEIAWLLIFRALTQAMAGLVDDSQDLFKQIDNHDIEIIVKHRLETCLQKLEDTELTIDQNFFNHPEELAIVAAVKTPFRQWLEDIVETPAQAEAISDRLPMEFVYALHNEWKQHSDKYAVLQNELNTPFVKAGEREKTWQRYSTWLQKQINERMFSEAFSLEQVYISPRAYYERKIEGNDDDDLESRLKDYYKQGQDYERIVVNLQDELQIWVDQADKNDAIRVISGGPGSGKSSFSKVFAATQAKKGKIKILFIPLHLFDPEDDLVNSVGKFINNLRDIPLPPNPLISENFVSQLLIIFDGLDELAMQGNIAEEIAQKFINEVERQVNSFNNSQTRLLVLISGRELVVQKNKSEFRKQKQILQILPYFVDEKEKRRHNYIDTQNLLKEDQREIWWCQYGKASGLGYPGLPEELDNGHLREITSQPLLNYLVALSFARGAVNFAKDSNLNEIYADLITAVYQRVWAKDNPIIKGVEEKDFVRILESIAVSAWHGGDVRITTIKEIENNCDSYILDRVFHVFKQDRKASLTRLLTAFYFRQNGVKGREETFEFTHKSFGEYLAAKRIVRELALIYKKLQANKEDPDDGWNKQEALVRWARLCGLTAMDQYIFNFIVDEIQLQQDKYQIDVAEWQQTMCDLISYMLKNEMPMEKLQLRTFQEANRQARNAEEALLFVLNACARVTQEISKIDRPSPEAFGNWISRLQRQRINFNGDISCLDCLSFLDLEDCVLILKDFFNANLQGANIQRANLQRANLEEANLQGANIQGANIQRANIQRANLETANLEEVNLKWAYLQNANLEGANLKWAELEGADLAYVSLQEANLEGANIQRANLNNAYLVEANLTEANLTEANLTDANLTDANLTDANLRGTILEGKV